MIDTTQGASVMIEAAVSASCQLQPDICPLRAKHWERLGVEIQLGDRGDRLQRDPLLWRPVVAARLISLGSRR